MDEYDSLDEVPIDWESPFDEIRSSEIDDITLKFLDNGSKVLREDEKGNEYTQFKFKCIRTDISVPKEVLYTTSSKRLIEEMVFYAPIMDKTLQVIRSGTGFQTKYKILEA